MTMRLLAVGLLFLSGWEIQAEDVPQPANPYKAMPWHLADTWWDLGVETPFESLAVDVAISDSLPQATRLYIAPIGLGHLDKTMFYGGIQTQADGNIKKDRKLRNIGPGFLFSMWGQRSLDAIRPAEGGLCQSSGHEGDFVSVRRPYGWSKGTYTYRLTRMDRELVNGEPHTWVGAFVYSHEKDENVFVGALRFPGENLKLQRKVANFVEIYGPRIKVEEIPQVTVTFSPPVINGVRADKASAEIIYPKGVPDYANGIARDGSLVISVGKPVEGRDKRRIQLIPPGMTP